MASIVCASMSLHLPHQLSMVPPGRFSFNSIPIVSFNSPFRLPRHDSFAAGAANSISGLLPHCLLPSGMPNAAQSGMKNFPYVSHFSYGDRVRLTGLDGHPKKGGPCTIIYVLPNPSKKPEHQWYDVRFE